MKKFLFLLAILVSGCATYHPAPAQQNVITHEAPLPGMTKDEIFAKSRVWIQRHLYSKGDIIQNVDRNAGIIVANGYIDYPARGKSEETERIQQTISFMMREEAGNGFIRLTFYDLLLDIPKYYYPWRSWAFPNEYYGGYSVPIQGEHNVAAATRGLLDIADRLVEYLKQGQAE